MKKCKQGYYYCYTDEVCKPIPKGLRVTARFSGGGKEPEETGIDVPTNGNGDGNGNGNGDGGGVSESKSGDKSLSDWFEKSSGRNPKTGKKVPGWPQIGGKFSGAPCARQPGQTTKPKCGSSKMAANLDDKEEKKAFNKKQRQDPNPDRKGKAINVKTEETVVEKAGEKDACYKKVKSRYSVWPSAYASGALVKCRKVGAANWGNKSESVEYSDWRNDFKATEYEFIDIIKAEPLISESPSFEIKKNDEVQGPEVSKEKQWNAGPASRRAKEGIDRLKKKLKKEEKENEEIEIEEKKDPCWDTHKQVGMKKKGGKMVPNCVRKEEKEESKIDGSNLKKLAAKAVRRVDADVDGDVDTDDMKSPETGEFVPSPDGKKLKPKVRFEGASDWRNELDEGAAWTKKSGKNKKGGLNEKGRKSYEAENPGSDLKAPSKKKGNKRRASFCARMKGMKKKLTSAKTARDPDSRINKSLRAWNC